MAINRAELAHTILALLQEGAHSASWSDDPVYVDESDLVPEIGDELMLSGIVTDDDGTQYTFSASIHLCAEEVEVEDL